MYLQCSHIPVPRKPQMGVTLTRNGLQDLVLRRPIVRLAWQPIQALGFRLRSPNQQSRQAFGGNGPFCDLPIWQRGARQHSASTGGWDC
jgi:hypothetical protein